MPVRCEASETNGCCCVLKGHSFTVHSFFPHPFALMSFIHSFIWSYDFFPCFCHLFFFTYFLPLHDWFIIYLAHWLFFLSFTILLLLLSSFFCDLFIFLEFINYLIWCFINLLILSFISSFCKSFLLQIFFLIVCHSDFVFHTFLILCLFCSFTFTLFFFFISCFCALCFCSLYFSVLSFQSSNFCFFLLSLLVSAFFFLFFLWKTTMQKGTEGKCHHLVFYLVGQTVTFSGP